MPDATPLLEMNGIQKSFPGVAALRGVSLTARAGEVLALLGENGAGKSTLMKILGGVVAPDAGQIHLAGQPVQFRSPHAAIQAGIAIIHQELNLVPGLSARENIFLGQESPRWGLVARRRERERARELLSELGAEFDPDTPCRQMTVAQQQLTEIAKALSLKARLLVMDEPTAALTNREVERLFDVIRELKSRGLAIIYISHRLPEIFAIADRVTVLRDGRHVADRAIGEVDRQQLIELMVGRPLTDEFPPRQVALGADRLVVRGLRRGHVVRGVSFAARGGEVLGLTGLAGSGRTETVRLIFGADRADAGEVELDGRRLAIRRPRDAIRAGIGLLTEDRKAQGLILPHSVQHNFGLPNLRRWSILGWLRQSVERREFQSFATKLRIRLSSTEQAARNLSGGNQQKVVLAKWLARRCDVLIFDEPTRGVDVGAKYDIYQLINSLAAEGKVVILISSELPEVLGMADRILVLREGQIAGELSGAGVTQEQIMRLAVGESAATGGWG